MILSGLSSEVLSLMNRKNGRGFDGAIAAKKVMTRARGNPIRGSAIIVNRNNNERV